MPWVLLVVLFNRQSLLLPANEKVAMWSAILTSDHLGLLPTEIVLRLLAMKIHLTTYLALSWLELNRFRQCIYTIRSDNSDQVLTQLRALSIAFIALEAIWVSLFLAQQYAGIGTLSQVSEIWLLLISFIVLAMGFSGLQYPDLVFTHEERLMTEVADNPITDEKVKYIHSSLPESTVDEIAKLIERAMLEEKIYLNEKLTLPQLAKHLELKSHTISQVINQGMKTNFYKLVNSYRVQYATDLLDNNAIQWPIERVALESGFSNRVTFNKAFKEQFQCTASQYKKQQQKVS